MVARLDTKPQNVSTFELGIWIRLKCLVNQCTLMCSFLGYLNFFLLLIFGHPRDGNNQTSSGYRCGFLLATLTVFW